MATPTAITRFTPVFKPLTNITPFTFRDAYTVLDLYERLREFLAETLTPEIDGKLTLIYDEVQSQVVALANDVNASKDAWQALFDQFMADVIVELEGLNDQAVANLVNNVNSQISIALNTHFASKATQTTVESGRLSPTALDTWWDDKFTTEHTHVVDIRAHGGKAEPDFDNSPAMNAAIAYATANGIRRVVTPGDTWYFGSVINLPSNIELDFMGANLRALPSTSGLFETTSKGATGYGSGGKNITLRNGTIWGDFVNNRIVGNSFHHAENLLVENMIFNEAVQNSHNLDLMGCKDVIIRNCKFRGRLNVEGRSYVEAVQIDHSTRGGAGPNLGENPVSFDGLPCVNILMENCVSEPIVVNTVEYLAPRLIGSHSRVSNVRHRNITVRNCRIVNSGATTSDQRYQGWIHFTHTDGLLVEGITFVNTRNDEAVAIGSWGVDTTYPLSSVSQESPQLTADAGGVSIKNVIIRNITLVGFKSVGNGVAVRIHGTGDALSGYAENISISGVVIDDASPGGEAAHGMHVVSAARVNGLNINDFTLGKVAVGVNAELCQDVNVSNILISEQCSTPTRIVNCVNVTVSNINSVGNNSCYLSGISFLTVSNIKHTVLKLGVLQYASGFSVTGCDMFTITGIMVHAQVGAGHDYAVRLYGNASNGVLVGGAVSNDASGFNFVNTVNVTVANTVVKA